MKYISFLALSVILLASCAGPKTQIPDENIKDNNSQFDESFDPLSLDDDDIRIKAEEPVQQSEAEQSTNQKPEQRIVSNEAFTESDGFRVQVFASRNIEAATIEQQDAIDKFGPLNHKVYLIFEAPFYKIRIGDARRRSEAENLRDVARDLGYKQAFPVRSKIKLYNKSESEDY